MKKQPLLLALAGFLFVLSASAQDITSLYNEGLALRQKKMYKEAIEKFTKVTLMDPRHFDSQYEMGWCNNELKNYGDAIIALRKARQLKADIAKVHFELGYAFQYNGNSDSALASYDRCLGINPKYSAVFKMKGYIYYDREKYDEALDNFTMYETIMAGNNTEIKEYLYWYRKGYMLNANKEYSSARVALLKSLEFKTDYTNTYLELGFASSRMRQDEEAIAYYQKAIALDPQSHIGYNGVAEVYRDNKKDMTNAIYWYEKTLAIKPTERKANFGKGYCLNSQGKYAEAISYLQTAINSESNYTAAYVDLGYSLYMLGRYEEGLTKLKAAIALNPSNVNARYYSGLIYIAQGNKIMAQKMADELKPLHAANASKLQAKVDAMN